MLQTAREIRGTIYGNISAEEASKIATDDLEGLAIKDITFVRQILPEGNRWTYVAELRQN